MKPQEQFLSSASKYLPGLLVCYDIADAKRRNCHLSPPVVDVDIQQCDAIIQASVGADGVARRVRGGVWLAIYKPGDLQRVKAVIADYHKEEAIEIGWRTDAERDGKEKHAECTVRTKVIRALRCMYGHADTLEEAEKVIEHLLRGCWGLPLEVPIPFEVAQSMERRNWSCVANYPVDNPFCPFCERQEFEWEDGDMSVYSGSGKCKICGAEIDIRGIQSLVVL